MQHTASEEKSTKWCHMEKDSCPLGEMKKDRISTCVQLIIKPLRIFQFLMVLLIFVLIIYTIMLADPKLSSIICILLIVLTGVYLLVLSIDLINHFIGQDTHSIPIFVFSFLGTIFFGAAAIFLLAIYPSSAPWYISTIAGTLLSVWILFIIDVSLILAFWKRNCNLCKQCINSKQTDVFLQKDACHPACIETVKYDLMTSISSIKVSSGDENAVPDHSCRKIGYGRRRQYVDCPTSAQVLNLTDAADIQTELHQTNTVQSQTEQDKKETLVQTVSRCELCNRKMQAFPNTADPSLHAPCPALVQLLSGSSCCPGCRCITGIVQVSQQQSQQQQTKRTNNTKGDKEHSKDQTQWIKSMGKKTNETLTSKEHQLQDPNLAGTITELTLAPYCMRANKTDTPCQTSNTEADKALINNITKKTNEEASVKKMKLPTEKRGKEHEKSDVKKKIVIVVPEKEKEKPVNDNTRKRANSYTKKVLESCAIQLLENSKKITGESPAKKSKGSNKKELTDTATEKSIELSKVTVSETPIGNTAKSPKKEVVQSSAERANVKSTKKNVKLESNNEKVNNNPGQKRLILQPRQTVQIVNRPEHKNKEGKTAASLPASPSVNRKTKNTSDLKDGKQIATIAKTNSSNYGRKENANSPLDVSSISKLRVQATDSDAGKAKVSVSTTRTERSQETDIINKPDIGTQTYFKAASLKNNRPFGFRTKNKVAPSEITHTDIDIQTVGCTDNNASTSKQETEILFAETSGSSDERIINICPACKQTQVTAASNTPQYYNVHRNKLKYKSDICPNCGQAQTCVQPTVSA